MGGNEMKLEKLKLGNKYLGVCTTPPALGPVCRTWVVKNYLYSALGGPECWNLGRLGEVQAGSAM